MCLTSGQRVCSSLAVSVTWVIPSLCVVLGLPLKTTQGSEHGHVGLWGAAGTHEFCIVLLLCGEGGKVAKVKVRLDMAAVWTEL